jgi:hypothetical protein
MSAENARVKVLVRLRPPADPSINPSDTIKLFPEQPGLLNIRYGDISRISTENIPVPDLRYRIRSKSSDDGEPTQREFLFDGSEGIDATQSVWFLSVLIKHPFQILTFESQAIFDRYCQPQVDHP